MNNFIKKDEYVFKMPEGLAYDLEPNRTYRLTEERQGFDWVTVLKADGYIKEPKKYYATKNEKRFCDKIVNYYNKYDDNNVGVMLYGKQGCGKTFTAREIARRTNLPIIIVDPNCPTNKLTKFFSDFRSDICIIFDEFDKYVDQKWDTVPLLEFLDGIQKLSRKLVIFTCNDEKVFNEFMLDRPTRIRYYRKFEVVDTDLIKEIVEDSLEDKNRIDEVTNYIRNSINLPSYDIVTSFIKEVNDNPEDDLSELAADMNINTSALKANNNDNKKQKNKKKSEIDEPYVEHFDCD